MQLHSCRVIYMDMFLQGLQATEHWQEAKGNGVFSKREDPSIRRANERHWYSSWDPCFLLWATEKPASALSFGGCCVWFRWNLLWIWVVQVLLPGAGDRVRGVYVFCAAFAVIHWVFQTWKIWFSRMEQDDFSNSSGVGFIMMMKFGVCVIVHYNNHAII